MRITSVSNPRIKQLVRLQESRTRRESGMFLINGVRETLQACECGIEILEVYAQENEAPELLMRQIERSYPAAAFFEVPKHVFDKIAFGERREGILVVAQARVVTGENVWNEFWKQFDSEQDKAPLFAVVEKMEKPGNLGAVFRSADGAGFDAVLIANPRCDLYNPSTIRCSLGTVFHLPVVIDSSQRILQELLEHRISPAAAWCNDSRAYTECDFTIPSAIVLGTESSGLSETWKHPEVRAVHIPMLGYVDSLNVSNAAAILFYEARRQRG